MRRGAFSAAAVAVVAVPAVLTGWAGPQAAQASAVPHANDGCNPSDSEVKYKADLVLTDRWGNVVDSSNTAGTVALLYSHRCRWTQAAVSLDNPVPSGKRADADLNDWNGHPQAVCYVEVGGQGCATTWENDANIRTSAIGGLNSVNDDNADYYVGYTDFY